MGLEELNNAELQITDKKTAERYNDLKLLIEAIATKEIPPEIVFHINPLIQKANTLKKEDKKPGNTLHEIREKIIKILEKEINMVPRKYYQKKWIPLGMVVFGLPLGAAFSIATGNVGLLGAGLASGLAIGLGYGKQLDYKAEKKKRVLETDY